MSGNVLEQCLGCLPGRNEEDLSRDDLGGRSGVKREMKIAHNQQPHLVPPMKLVFYGDMPSTPNAIDRSDSRMTEWPDPRDSWRRSATKRQSVFRKRMTNTRRPPLRTISPVQRIPAFRPLQLSIYLPDNRLSDLPEFNLADFDNNGEITMPPKAVTRAKSEAILPQLTSNSSPRKGTQSMVDWRPRTDSIPTEPLPVAAVGYPAQRQSVTWNSLPGLATSAKEPTMSGGLETARPQTPPAVPAPAQPIRLTFPPVDREDSQAPTTTIISTPPRPTVSDFPRPPAAITPPRPAPTLSRQTTPNARVSQWLERSNTTSTTSSTSTARRVGRKSPPSKLSISAPIPINPPEHIRTTSIKSIGSQAAISQVASVHSMPSSPPGWERTATMTSLTPSNAPSQQPPRSAHSRNRTTSSSTIASTALSSLLNPGDAASISSYTTMTTSPPAIHNNMMTKALMPALPIQAPAAITTTTTATDAPLTTIKDESVVTILPIPESQSESDNNSTKSNVHPAHKDNPPSTPLTAKPVSAASPARQQSGSPTSTHSSSSGSDSDGPITPPRQRMLASARKGSVTNSQSHWSYLPKQYADVWKRETVVGEADVGMAF